MDHQTLQQLLVALLGGEYKHPANAVRPAIRYTSR